MLHFSSFPSNWFKPWEQRKYLTVTFCRVVVHHFEQQNYWYFLVLCAAWHWWMTLQNFWFEPITLKIYQRTTATEQTRVMQNYFSTSATDDHRLQLHISVACENINTPILAMKRGPILIASIFHAAPRSAHTYVCHSSGGCRWEDWSKCRPLFDIKTQLVSSNWLVLTFCITFD